MKSMDEYEELLADRPEKFDAEDVGYDLPEVSAHRCARCIHYYERKRDSFGVCEIFRSDDTDEHGVDPDMGCSFWTPDGEEFPLRKAR